MEHHPKSLSIFFSTEMWERFGFYVVQTLLALYLSLHLKWEDKSVYALVGSFTALTYISPIFGGWVADHLLGQKRSIYCGGFILLLSYIALAQSTSQFGLIASLAGIAAGTGFFKPNISSLLGNEYSAGSPLRENGFTIFFMGITTGIVLGTTFPNLINTRFGWSAAFFSASIGMLFGILIFKWGVSRYKIQDYLPHTLTWKKSLQVILGLIIVWVAFIYILNYNSVANMVFISIALLSTAYFVHVIKKEDKHQSKKTTVIALLCIISALFWALYFQMFMAITLLITRTVDLTLWGISFPPPYYVAIQSLGAIGFGYLLSRKKTSIKNTSKRTLQTGDKFLRSMLFMSSAFALITGVCALTNPTLLISPLYIMPAYLLISLAELYLYPVGLSAVTWLSDNSKVSTFMGIFFVSLGVGAFLAGKLASITAISDDSMSLMEYKIHYAHSFGKLLIILVCATLICAGINRMIHRLLRDIP